MIELEEPPKSEEMGSISLGEAGRVEDRFSLSIHEICLESLLKGKSFKEFCLQSVLQMMKAIKCEAASMFELDYQNQDLFFRAVTGSVSEKVYEFRIPKDQGIVGKVIQEKRSMMIKSAESQKEHLKAISHATGFEVRDMLATPLFVQGKVFGALEVLNGSKENGLDETDLERLEKAAEILGKYIEIKLMMMSLGAKNRAA